MTIQNHTISALLVFCGCVVIAAAAFMYAAGNFACASYAENTGMKTRFSFPRCYVQAPTRQWMTLDEYRSYLTAMVLIADEQIVRGQ